MIAATIETKSITFQSHSQHNFKLVTYKKHFKLLFDVSISYNINHDLIKPYALWILIHA